EKRGDEDGADREQHNPVAHAPVGAHRKQQRHRYDQRQGEMKPGAAREAEEQTAEQGRDHDEAADTKAARHEAYDQQQQRKNQKRAVNVRILEGRADALIVEKVLIAGHQVKKTEIPRQRRDQSGEQVGAAQDAEPRQVALAEQTREHDAGRAEIDRRAGVLDGVLLVADLHQRHKSAEQPDDRQDQQWQELAVERHASGNAHRQQHEHQRVVRLGLDKGDRAQRHGDEQRDVEQALRQRRRAGDTAAIERRLRRVIRRAQYALSVRNSANGVHARMYMSNGIDQFSM